MRLLELKPKFIMSLLNIPDVIILYEPIFFYFRFPSLGNSLLLYQTSEILEDVPLCSSSSILLEPS